TSPSLSRDSCCLPAECPPKGGASDRDCFSRLTRALDAAVHKPSICYSRKRRCHLFTGPAEFASASWRTHSRGQGPTLQPALGERKFPSLFLTGDSLWREYFAHYPLQSSLDNHFQHAVFFKNLCTKPSCLCGSSLQICHGESPSHVHPNVER